MNFFAEVHWTATAGVWAVAGATLAAAAGAIISYFLLRSETDPVVIVYPEADRRRPSVMVLIVKNIGKGVARDVRFTLSEPIVHAWGMEGLSGEPSRLQSGPLIDGIPFLAPQAERVINWGQYGGLLAVLGDRSIRIEASYYSDRTFPIMFYRHRTQSFVDVRSFSETDASDSNWDRRAAEALEKIAKRLERLVVIRGKKQ